jgi:hypothetical protein
MSGLDWPENFERTDASERESYPNGFRVTRSQAFDNILDELASWDGVRDVQLDTGAEHQVRNPNKPYANADYDDPGVVVRFEKDGKDMAAACDRWDNPRDNGQDLYHYLHETRMQEQRGTVTGQSEYEKLRLPSGDEDAVVAGTKPPHEVLGVEPDAGPETVQSAWQQRVKEAHPDAGGPDEGSREELKKVNAAKKVMLDG